MQEHQAWWPIDANGCPYPWPDERWPDSELEEEVELQSQSDEELIPPLVGDEDSDEELVEELWFQDREDMNRGVCRGEAEGVLGRSETKWDPVRWALDTGQPAGLDDPSERKVGRTIDSEDQADAWGAHVNPEAWGAHAATCSRTVGTPRGAAGFGRCRPFGWKSSLPDRSGGAFAVGQLSKMR